MSPRERAHHLTNNHVGRGRRTPHPDGQVSFARESPEVSSDWRLYSSATMVAAMPQSPPPTSPDSGNGLRDEADIEPMALPLLPTSLQLVETCHPELLISILSETGRIERGHPYLSAACPDFNGGLNIVRCFVERPKVDFDLCDVQRKEPAATVRAERAAGISGHLPGIAELAHLPICRCQEDRACRLSAVRTMTEPSVKGLALYLEPNGPAQASTGSM